jgi:hypothetical protein
MADALSARRIAHVKQLKGCRVLQGPASAAAPLYPRGMLAGWRHRVACDVGVRYRPVNEIALARKYGLVAAGAFLPCRRRSKALYRHHPRAIGSEVSSIPRTQRWCRASPGRRMGQIFRLSWAGFCRIGVPTGIRTPVTAVKGRCPRPLDDGDCRELFLARLAWLFRVVEVSGIEPLTFAMPLRRSPS